MSAGQRRIGMIGIGMMGHGIATNVVKHGHPLAFLEHPGNQPVDALVSAGARGVPTIAALAAEADVVILCVTGSPEVESVLFQAGGLLESMRPGTTIVDCSTAIPSSTLRIAEAVAKAGGRFLDAPMTRTPKEAAEGRLNLLVGGEAALFDECRPLLACFAENIVHAGPVGAGHRMKLLHNYVSLGFSAVLAEAAACAQRADVDPHVFMEVLAKGGGGGVVLERLRPYIEAKQIAAFRFSISNALKDIGYYTTMAGEIGASVTAAEGIRRTLEDAVAAGRGGAAVPELIDLLAAGNALRASA
ncbi:NAD(P)-dependent oxidoreductase [Burkholderiaceae bacterium FT117]|uniref:NAD(P)-dependent oxidoreductase n=1 Tax=Zeimonas sediminis TaxID=2944268 RepID=UPI002342BFD0|nr:NAD(P)-dependent oxidoreductase [Zeimonas sediminis]MCM5569702.1 NAD(P)-dependent oxidoreductase [Zeimonas sediminis]